MACLLLAASAAALAPAVQASASSFRRLAPRVIAFASDGSRYAAWEPREGAPIVVLDTRTGRRHAFKPPQHCELKSQHRGGEPSEVAAAGRFLLTCDGWLDARTGAVTDLPGGPNGSEWQRIGSRSVEGVAARGTCRRTQHEEANGLLCRAIYDIATGTTSRRPFSQPPDLDLSGAPTVCPTLRGRLIADEEGADVYSYAEGLLAEDAAPKPGRPFDEIRVEGCRGRTKLIHTPPNPVALYLRGGTLTWDTAQTATEFNAETPGASEAFLQSYSLATGRRHTWQLPRITIRAGQEQPRVTVVGYSTHTANAVFWFGLRTVVPGQLGFEPATYAVYSALFR